MLKKISIKTISKISEDLNNLYLFAVNNNSFDGIGNLYNAKLKAIADKHKTDFTRMGIQETILLLKSKSDFNKDPLLKISKKYIKILQDYKLAIQETKNKKIVSRHKGNNKKLISISISDSIHKPIKSLNKMIEKSDYDVFTSKNKNGKGKHLLFNATKEEWADSAEYDCRDNKEGEDGKSLCELERIQEDQPEYCLMGNPRSCIGRATRKLLLERQSGRSRKSIADKQQEDYYSQFDNLTKEEIEEVGKEIFQDEEIEIF